MCSSDLYAQDKLAMRQRLAALGVACPRWARVDSADDVAAFAEDSGWPVVLKAVSGGYDGKGVWVCATPDEAADVLAHGIDLMAEEYVAFERELAVLVVERHDVAGAGERAQVIGRAVVTDLHPGADLRGALAGLGREHPEPDAEAHGGLRGHPGELPGSDHAHHGYPRARRPRVLSRLAAFRSGRHDTNLRGSLVRRVR